MHWRQLFLDFFISFPCFQSNAFSQSFSVILVAIAEDDHLIPINLVSINLGYYSLFCGLLLLLVCCRYWIRMRGQINRIRNRMEFIINSLKCAINITSLVAILRKSLKPGLQISHYLLTENLGNHINMNDHIECHTHMTAFTTAFTNIFFNLALFHWDNVFNTTILRRK